MKRLLCMMMCLALVFSFCACGKDSPAGSNPSETGALAETNNGNNGGSEFLNNDGTIVRPEFAGENVQLESTVPFEGEFLKAEITSLVAYPSARLDFFVKVENLSDKQVRLELGHTHINGLRLEPNSIVLQDTYKIEPRQTLELTFMYGAYQFSQCGISKVYNGEVRFKAVQQDGPYELEQCEGMVSFKTSETGEQVNYTEGQTVYDKGGLKIILQNTGWLDDDQFGHIRVYAENNSDTCYWISIEEVLIAPYGIYEDSKYRGIEVIPNYSSYYTEWVKISEIKDSLPIQTISLTIKVCTGDNLYSGNSWNPSETFTVDLSDWDWSAIKG